MLRHTLKELLSWLVTIGMAVGIIFIINTEIFAMVQVEQQSMESTLYAGERLFIDRVGWKLGEPHRGDIIIFLPDREVGTFSESASLFFDDYKSVFTRKDAPRRYVKRVVGLPGDEVNIENGRVFINGHEMEEKYVVGKTYTAEQEFPLIVPEGELFVMGDNREVSRDSRAFGTIDQDSVVGRAIFRLIPFARAGFLES